MRRVSTPVLTLLLVSCAVSCFAQAPPGSAISQAAAPEQLLKPGLDRLIRSRLGQPELEGASVSVLVESRDGLVLYERASERPMVPASNMKIVTGACALSRLGQDYEFVTEIGTDGLLGDGVLVGDIYVRGSGDPSLVSEELWKICEALRARGVRTIAGDLVLDDSLFDDARTATAEADEGDRAYNARTGALSLNFNTVAVHVYPGENRGDEAVVSVTPDVGIVELRSAAMTGSSRRGSTIDVRRAYENGRNVVRVTGRIPDDSPGRTFYRNLDEPTETFGLAFRGFLAHAGIELEGGIVHGDYPEDALLLHRHKSKALSLVVRDLGKYSNNFIAEQLLKTLGAELRGAPGTTAAGTDVLSSYLVSIGVDEASFNVADGSGFSMENRLTTRAIVRVIKAMLEDYETSYEFVASLSVGGVDGTLDDRMRFPGLRGSVRAKTGLLTGVTAISGLLRTVAGDELVFSIITNGSGCEAWRLHDLEHEILAYAARETPALGSD